MKTMTGDDFEHDLHGRMVFLFHGVSDWLYLKFQDCFR